MFPFEPGSRSAGIKTLVCASLLVCVPAAMPQVTAIGSECHRAQVGDAVARVRARSPEVARMLDELEEAKYACRVVRRTSGPSTVDTDAKQVTIGWPGRSGTYADGSCIDPDANLVHEAYHCWVRSKNEGFEPCKSVPTRTVSGALVVAAASCEFDAVRFENRYRKAIGLCERLTYDIFEVPGAERTCRAAEAACTPGVGSFCSVPPLRQST